VEFLLCVATFNRRAITVYERIGFVRRRVYMHRTGGREWEFIELQRRCSRLIQKRLETASGPRSSSSEAMTHEDTSGFRPQSCRDEERGRSRLFPQG
jgi:hypothetical protein